MQVFAAARRVWDVGTLDRGKKQGEEQEGWREEKRLDFGNVGRRLHRTVEKQDAKADVRQEKRIEVFTKFENFNVGEICRVKSCCFLNFVTRNSRS